jgi:hypothetical protein
MMASACMHVEREKIRVGEEREGGGKCEDTKS